MPASDQVVGELIRRLEALEARVHELEQPDRPLAAPRAEVRANRRELLVRGAGAAAGAVAGLVLVDAHTTPASAAPSPGCSPATPR